MAGKRGSSKFVVAPVLDFWFAREAAAFEAFVVFHEFAWNEPRVQTYFWENSRRRTRAGGFGKSVSPHGRDTDTSHIDCGNGPRSDFVVRGCGFLSLRWWRQRLLGDCRQRRLQERVDAVWIDINSSTQRRFRGLLVCVS